MEHVFAPARGAILLASLGVVASAAAMPDARSHIEPIYALEGGHADAVFGSMFSPDGTLLIVCGNAASTVWDVGTGRSLYRLPAPGWWGCGYAFSGDGRQLVAHDGRMRVLDAHSGRVLHERAGRGLALRFSPAGDRVAVARDTVTELWSLADDRVVELGTTHVMDLAWSADGSEVAIASVHDKVDVWDARTGVLVATLPHEGMVNQVRFVAGAIVTATHRHVRRWDPASHGVLTDIALPSQTWQVELAPDGATAAGLVHGSSDVMLFDLEHGRLAHTVAHAATHMVFDASGAYVVTAGDGIRIWNARTGALVRSLDPPDEGARASLSPGGGVLATTAWWDLARLWDVATGVRVGILGGHRDGVTALAIAPDGRFLATASARGSDATAKLWLRETGRLVASFDHAGPVERLAFTPDGERLLTGDAFGNVVLWNTTTHERDRVLAAHGGAITALAVARDGASVLSASSDATARIWDLDTGATRHVLRSGYPIADAALTPDGRTVVTAGTRTGATATIWDAATGTPRATLALGDRCRAGPIAIAGDGGSVLTTCGGEVRVWKLPTGEPLHVLAVTNAVVLAARFSPDDATILATASDGAARLWDRATGGLRATLADDDGLDVDAAFAGDLVVTTGRYTGTLRLWDGPRALEVVDSHQDQLLAIARDPVDGARFYTLGEDTIGTLRAWRITR